MTLQLLPRYAWLVLEDLYDRGAVNTTINLLKFRCAVSLPQLGCSTPRELSASFVYLLFSFQLRMSSLELDLNDVYKLDGFPFDKLRIKQSTPLSASPTTVHTSA